MRFEYNPAFIDHFLGIWHYIAQESVDRANSFEKQLRDRIEQLTHFPYKYRVSYYYQDDAIRDLIFKGYTIPYYIDETNQKIVILDIFKWTDKERKT